MNKSKTIQVGTWVTLYEGTGLVINLKKGMTVLFPTKNGMRILSNITPNQITGVGNLLKKPRKTMKIVPVGLDDNFKVSHTVQT